MIERLQKYDGKLTDLAQKAGVSVSLLCDIRKGRVKNSGHLTVQKIERALDAIELEGATPAEALAKAGAEAAMPQITN